MSDSAGALLASMAIVSCDACKLPYMYSLATFDRAGLLAYDCPARTFSCSRARVGNIDICVCDCGFGLL